MVRRVVRGTRSVSPRTVVGWRRSVWLLTHVLQCVVVVLIIEDVVVIIVVRVCGVTHGVVLHVREV